jgi:hypothetical protein
MSDMPYRPITCRCGFTFDTEPAFEAHLSVSTTAHWRVSAYPPMAAPPPGGGDWQSMATPA